MVVLVEAGIMALIACIGCMAVYNMFHDDDDD